MKTMTQGVVLSLVVGSLVVGLSGCGPKPAKRQSIIQEKPVAGDVSSAESGRVICEDDLRDVFFISSATLPKDSSKPPVSLEATVGFAVGEANTLLKTVDRGLTWRRVLPRDPKGPDFVQIMFTSVSNGWAVSGGVLLHTRDMGETWSPAAHLPGNFYYFGPSSGTPAAFYQMQPATYGNRVYRTRNGGETWQALPAALSRNDYESVFFLNDDLGWVSARAGQVELTKDGGATWERADIPKGGHLVQIQFVDPQTGWARPVDSHEGGLQTSRDGGRTWSRQDAGIKSYSNIEDMQFLDMKTGFILVRESAKRAVVLRTKDGGVSWAQLGDCIPGAAAISFVGGGTGWVVGAGGRLFAVAQNY